MTIHLEKRLHYCFNTVDVREEEINDSIRIWRTLEDPTDDELTQMKKAANSYLYGLYKQFKEALTVVDVMTDKVRETINNAFVEHLSGKTVKASFGQDTLEWRAAYSSYVDTVVTNLQKCVQEMETSRRLERMDEDMQKALKQCALKAKVVLMTEHRFVPFRRYPFMSRSVWSVLVDNFKLVQNSLVEVRFGLLSGRMLISPQYYTHVQLR